MEDMIVQDTAGDEEDSENTEENKNNKSVIDSPKKLEEKMEVDESEKVSRKRENKDEAEATQPKKQCLEKEEKNEEDHKTENNTDAEDSINLDIGDDELLNEEVCFYVFKVNFTLPSVKTNFSNGYLMEVD